MEDLVTQPGHLSRLERIDSPNNHELAVAWRRTAFARFVRVLILMSHMMRVAGFQFAEGRVGRDVRFEAITKEFQGLIRKGISWQAGASQAAGASPSS